MALRRPRPDPEDPLRRDLLEVRRALFRLHKALVDAERASRERTAGPLPSALFLQSLLQDPELAWLRPFSGLIVEMDEALASAPAMSPAAMSEYVDRVERLVSAADEPNAGVRNATRYGEASRRDPEVLLAHVELMSRIQTARENRQEG